MPSFSIVRAFSLRLPTAPRIRKDSHVAKSEAPSSPTPVKAQLRRAHSLNVGLQYHGDDVQSPSYSDGGFPDSYFHPPPTPSISSPCRASPSEFSPPLDSPAMLAQSDTDRDIHETIKQLEQLAHELRAMDIDITPPHFPRRKVVRPPPRRSSLHHRMSVIPECNSSSSSRPSTAKSTSTATQSTLSVPFPSSLAYLNDHHASNERLQLTTTPRIVLTVPSAEQLNTVITDDERTGPAAEGEEMDEVQWVEEYGQWGDTSSESDGASDRASVASSLFLNGSNSSSISLTPPNSPPILTPDVSLFVLSLITLFTRNIIVHSCSTFLPIHTLPLWLDKLRASRRNRLSTFSFSLYINVFY